MPRYLDSFNEGSGFIYIVQIEGTDYYKIGCTRKEPLKRIKALEFGLPYNIHAVLIWKAKGPFLSEASIHNLFKGKRVKGEWFKLSPFDIYKMRSELVVKNIEMIVDNLAFNDSDVLRIECSELINIKLGKLKKFLSIAQKEEIRRRYGQSGETLKSLANEYGVHWSTISRIVHGKKPRGIKRKLSFAQAEEVRSRFQQGERNMTALARAYGVSLSSISHIIKGIQYKQPSSTYSSPVSS